MPLYEYQCKACQERFSEILSIKESDDVPACPSCGSEDVQKLVSSVSVVRSAQEKAEERLHETYSAHKFVRTEGIP